MRGNETASGLTVQNAMHAITRALSMKYGNGEAKAMARIIFENLKGWTPVDIAIKASEEISPFIEGRINEIVNRLIANEPIQYIFGTADFYGFKLKVTTNTLIPRPETAELVDLIVKDNRQKDLKVIDLGTGSGCIAIALSRNLPFADITAIDISEKALDVAKENARVLRCKIRFAVGDMLKLPDSDNGVGSGYDIVVSNPPYITLSEKSGMERNVTDFEPADALFVPDNSPLKFYDAAMKFGLKSLNYGGKLYFEINPLFAEQLKIECEALGYLDVGLFRDSFGKFRFMKAVKPE